MTQPIAYLEAVIGADITSFRRGMSEVRRETGFLSDTMGSFGKLGRQMTFALTAPLVAFGGMATKTAGDFEAAMRNVASISSTVANDLDGFSKMVQEMGENTVAGPIETAAAFYEIFSAGVEDAGKAQKILQASIYMSEAGLADLSNTTQTLTGVMNGFSDTTLTAAHASDVYLRMVQLGVGELENFSNAQKYIMPTLSALNLELEDGAAMWAYYTQQNVDAGTAARGLSMAITNMIKPSEAMQGLLAKTGASDFLSLIEQTGSLKDAFVAVREAASGPDEIIRAFSQRGGRAFLAITENLDGLNSSYSQFMSGLEGATMTAREQQMAGFNMQVKLLQSAFESFMITVGEQIIPIITPFVTKLRELLINAGDAAPEIIKLGVAIAGAAAAAGPLLWLIGSLTSPIALLAGAAAALAMDVGGVRTAIEGMIPPEVKQAVDDFFTTVTDIITTLQGEEITPTVFPSAEAFVPEPIDVPFYDVVNFTVEPGDTPGQLAAELGVSIQDILDATGADSVYTMPVGEFTLNKSKTTVNFRGLNDMVEQATLTEKPLIRQTVEDALASSTEGGIVGAVGRIDTFLASSGLVELRNIFQGVTLGIALAGFLLQKAFTSIQNGVSGFMAELGNLDTEGVALALGTLFTAISGAVSVSFVFAANIIEKVLPKVGALITDFLNVFGAAARGDMDAAGAALLKFFDDLALIPVDIAEGVLEAYEEITGIPNSGVAGLQAWADIPGYIVTALSGLPDYIGGVLDLAVTRLRIGINQLKVNFLLGLSSLLDQVREPLESIGVYVPNVDIDLSQTQLQLDKDKLKILLNEQLGQGTFLDNILMGIPIDQMGFDFSGSNVAQGATLWGLLQQAGFVDSLDQATLNRITSTLTQQLTEAIQNGDAEAATGAASVLDLLGVDPESIIADASTTATDFGTAIHNGLANWFGEEGTIPALWNTAWSALAGAVSDESSNMVASVGLIKTAIEQLAGKIAAVKSGIEGLQSMSIPSVGSAVGAYATGGYMKAGETAIVGERGPEIFTASRSGFVLPNSSLRGGIHSGSGGGTNIVNINGVQDVDGILFELRRRGVVLT